MALRTVHTTIYLNVYYILCTGGDIFALRTMSLPPHTCLMHTPYMPYAHPLHTLCAHLTHLTCTPYAHYVPYMNPLHALLTPLIHLMCTPYMPYMHTLHALCTHLMHLTSLTCLMCTPYAPYMHTLCTLCTPLMCLMCTPYAPYVPYTNCLQDSDWLMFPPHPIRSMELNNLINIKS